MGDADTEPLTRKNLACHLFQGVELFMAEHLGLLQVEERELRRLKYDMMGVIEGPVMELEAVFQRHLFIKLRAGQGCQDKELSRGQPGFFGEIDRLFHRRPIVLVESQDEHPVDFKPLSAEDLDGPDKIGHGLLLFHAVETLGINRLEADVNRVAAGLFHQSDEFGIVGEIGPDLSRPLEFEPLPYHGLKKILGPLPVGRKIIVIKENVGFRVIVPAELLDDVLR